MRDVLLHGAARAAGFAVAAAAATLLGSSPARAQAPAAAAPQGRPAAEPLWPKGAPGAKGAEPADVPTLALYQPPTGVRNGAAVVVCPGGGYGHLADHEGDPVARWLNTLGVTAVVLRYRIAPRYGHPAPLQDAQRALRTLRARAGELGIDPHRVGILGFSAGGHLASSAATHFDAGDAGADDPVERQPSRPDFAILLYPVITFDPKHAHMGSRQNLIGKEPSAELVTLYSNEKQVTKETPPTFLMHTADDAAVPVQNSLLFTEACRAHGVPVELHVFEHGRHGVGLAADDPVLSVWTSLCASWMRARGFLGPNGGAAPAP